MFLDFWFWSKFRKFVFFLQLSQFFCWQKNEQIYGKNTKFSEKILFLQLLNSWNSDTSVYIDGK